MADSLSNEGVNQTTAVRELNNPKHWGLVDPLLSLKEHKEVM